MHKDSRIDFSPYMASLVKQAEVVIQKNRVPVLMPNEFRGIVRDILPKGVSFKRLEQALEQSGVIRHITLRNDNYRDVDRISIPSLKLSVYHHAVSLGSNAYLCHASAVHILGLTQQRPKTIYVNKEQSPKPKAKGELTQESIDRAFARPQRHSNYIFRIEDSRIVLISGKSTGHAGVIDDDTTRLPVTCLERTLIDITVRPRYAGGVFQVSRAFREALDEIDIEKMLRLLNKLDYRYPYHQSLGFYLERAGANATTLESLRLFGINFDFYLDYSMANPSYDASWRVFFPLGI